MDTITIRAEAVTVQTTSAAGCTITTLTIFKPFKATLAVLKLLKSNSGIHYEVKVIDGIGKNRVSFSHNRLSTIIGISFDDRINTVILSLKS